MGVPFKDNIELTVVPTQPNNVINRSFLYRMLRDSGFGVVAYQKQNGHNIDPPEATSEKDATTDNLIHYDSDFIFEPRIRYLFPKEGANKEYAPALTSDILGYYYSVANDIYVTLDTDIAPVFWDTNDVTVNVSDVLMHKGILFRKIENDTTRPRQPLIVDGSSLVLNENYEYISVITLIDEKNLYQGAISVTPEVESWGATATIVLNIRAGIYTVEVSGTATSFVFTAPSNYNVDVHGALTFELVITATATTTITWPQGTKWLGTIDSNGDIVAGEGLSSVKANCKYYLVFRTEDGINWLGNIQGAIANS